jgi:hypothetical protein
VRVFLDYLRIEYLWHALIMPLTNRNGIRANFRELRQGEVRRIYLPRTLLNRPRPLVSQRAASVLNFGPQLARDECKLWD